MIMTFADNMGIARPDILTFARPPVKKNVYQELLVIKKLLYRWALGWIVSSDSLNLLLCVSFSLSRRFFRDLGFLLELISTGQKIQVFVRSREMLNILGK